MNYQEALDWIHGRVAFGSRPGLIRIETLLKKLGSPEKRLKPCISVGRMVKARPYPWSETI